MGRTLVEAAMGFSRHVATHPYYQRRVDLPAPGRRKMEPARPHWRAADHWPAGRLLLVGLPRNPRVRLEVTGANGEIIRRFPEVSMSVTLLLATFTLVIFLTVAAWLTAAFRPLRENTRS